MAHRNSSNLQPFLDRLNLRSRLLKEEQEAVLNLPVYAAQVRPNEDHVALGEMTDHATFVVSGVLGRFDQNANGERQITALHIAGDMADLNSVVEPRATSALQALSTTTILQVPHRPIREMTARYPALAEAFWRDCMVDAAVLAQWVVNLGRRSAAARIAHLLCETATRCRQGDDKQALRFDFPLTQAQLADATGLTSIHVNRTLKTLSGTVAVAQKSVDILDWDALAARGDFNRTYLQADIRPSERLRIMAA
ncbi:Crp/Fnr family transcriptional regulator [Phenylobacterium deserti]|uniref:Crp/Fnr family transcriptional regulator n=1 Tax=Phenylobacterium deserti TaxID=1914756 RepID=A0A328ATX1_9CAUL|nr:Crp/Fnr family transcriptional regulator [Phenylobacterium deserti]